MSARMASAQQVAAAKEAIVEAAFQLVETCRKSGASSDDAVDAWSKFHVAVRALGSMATPGPT